MAVGSVQHLTNGAYGFPRAKPRRVQPVALACVHVTGNSRTAAYTDLHRAAQAERNYANRDRDFDTSDPDYGPTATDYVARDGWAIEALDWKRYAAWSNGDISSPNTANPGIRRVLALRAKGYNANEGYWFEFENVGFGSSYPVTADQRQHCAERIAEAARYSGLPINRETVHGHWEINGVNRQNCPSPIHEAFLLDVIARARGSEDDEVKQPVITNTTEMWIDIPSGAPIYGADAETPVGKNGGAKVNVRSPWGSYTKRVYVTDLDGSGDAQKRSNYYVEGWQPAANPPAPEPAPDPEPAAYTVIVGGKEVGSVMLP